MRKARPGDVQPNPTIKKVRLPPGGSLTVDPNDLSSADARLVQTLITCGCLRVFAITSSGPMRIVTSEEIGELCDLSIPVPPPAAPAPILTEPEPAPTIPEPEPEPAVEEIVEEPEPEPEPEEDPGPEEAPYLKAELKAMKNADLRSILSDMDYGRTTGMNKSSLVDAILEMQES